MGGANGGNGLSYEVILMAQGEDVLAPELCGLGPHFDQAGGRPCLKMTEKVGVGAVAEKTGTATGTGRCGEAGLSRQGARPGAASAP